MRLHLHPFLFWLVSRVLRLFGYRLVDSRSGLLHGRGATQEAIYELCDKADKKGLERLRPPQRLVVLVWNAYGVMGNGGFRYFYEGRWEMAEVAEAFRTLGFPDAADACAASLNLFPARSPPPDHKQRRRLLAQIDFDALSTEERRIFRTVELEALVEAIERFMKVHASDFRR